MDISAGIGPIGLVLVSGFAPETFRRTVEAIEIRTGCGAACDAVWSGAGRPADLSMIGIREKGRTV